MKQPDPYTHRVFGLPFIPVVFCTVSMLAGVWLGVTIGWRNRDSQTRRVLDQSYGLTPAGDYLTKLDIVVGPGKYFDVVVRYDLVTKEEKNKAEP